MPGQRRRRGRRGGSLTLVQEVAEYGPLFEHLLNLKPWDLERMSTDDVQLRLAWIKDYQAQRRRDYDAAREGDS